jgi:hypothetical protein
MKVNHVLQVPKHLVNLYLFSVLFVRKYPQSSYLKVSRLPSQSPSSSLRFALMLCSLVMPNVVLGSRAFQSEASFWIGDYSPIFLIVETITSPIPLPMKISSYVRSNTALQCRRKSFFRSALIIFVYFYGGVSAVILNRSSFTE